jgi:hypothetical protein
MGAGDIPDHTGRLGSGHSHATFDGHQRWGLGFLSTMGGCKGHWQMEVDGYGTPQRMAGPSWWHPLGCTGDNETFQDGDGRQEGSSAIP